MRSGRATVVATAADLCDRSLAPPRRRLRRRSAPHDDCVLIGIDASRAVLARRTGTERYALEIIRALTRRPQSDDRFVLYFNQPPAPDCCRARSESAGA